MNIAIIAPIYHPIKSYSVGGGEVWTLQFIREIAKKQGNSIDLFAVDGSLSTLNRCNLIPISKTSIREIEERNIIKNASNTYAESQKILFSILAKAFALIKQFEKKYDLVIDSSGKLVLSLNWDIFSIPLFVIGHNPVSHIYTKIFSEFQLPKNAHFIFPSQYQAISASWIDPTQKHVIPHGIPMIDFPFQNFENKTDIIWLGRVDSNSKKGAEEAIKIASSLNMTINLYCSIQDREYFTKNIQPLLHRNIQITENEYDKNIIFKNGRLLLYPLQWEEPFGLVFLEAMASGTPVIAYARGSVPEVIKDGETGFIVNSSEEDKRGDWIIKKTGIEGLCEAVERIYAMPEEEYHQMRKNCREHVEKNFTVERMVDQYESLYKEIIEKNKNSLAR